MILSVTLSGEHKIAIKFDKSVIILTNWHYSALKEINIIYMYLSDIVL
jgi:hypothetical protein